MMESHQYLILVCINWFWSKQKNSLHCNWRRNVWEGCMKWKGGLLWSMAQVSQPEEHVLDLVNLGIEPGLAQHSVFLGPANLQRT